jgi:hypothetical protein
MPASFALESEFYTIFSDTGNTTKRATPPDHGNEFFSSIFKQKQMGKKKCRSRGLQGFGKFL